MTRYHFNPETGNAGICRAQSGNCPYLESGASHHESKREAQLAYEALQEQNHRSLAGRLMIARAKLQREIISLFTDPSKTRDDDIYLSALASERNAMERAIRNAETDYENWKPPVKQEAPRKIIAESVAVDRGSVIVGIPNVEEELTSRAPQTAKNLVKASEEWIANLSNDEAKAMWNYAGNPETANGRGEEYSRIIKKAPPMEPLTVYSGLGNHVADDVLSQFSSGTITLDYPISSSLNPAQVNGFMGRHKGFEPQKSIALEIETTVGGSMAAASHASHEFEVFLPAGSYEVIEQRENVQFLWNEDGVGRTADLLIKVRRLPD